MTVDEAKKLGKPWYGPWKDLHQEVICKYGNYHVVGVGSAKLIEWPEGFDCIGTCMDVDCGACEGRGYNPLVDENLKESMEHCDYCNGLGKMSRGRFAEYTLERESQDAPGDEKNA